MTDKDAWLCRNAVRWNLFWPFLFIFCGVGTMILNFMNWYMFLNRLSKFVKLRLSSDDTFVSFYSSKHIAGISKADLSSDLSQRSIDISTASATQLSMDFSTATPQTPQSPEPQTRRSRIRTSIAKIKKNQEKKKRRKARREKQQLMIYELIKKQSILSGIVAITDSLTWLPSIFIDGSTLILLNTMIGLTCVYLSFNFSKTYFDFCCKRFMDNCTCIEDRIERKLAKEMGLDMNEGDEDEENGLEEEFKDDHDVELQELNEDDDDIVYNNDKLNRRITEFKPHHDEDDDEHDDEQHDNEVIVKLPTELAKSHTNTEIDEDDEMDKNL